MKFAMSFIPFAAITALLLAACGDDHSSTNASAIPDEVADKTELNTYNCDMSIIGKKVFVTDLDKNYECDGDEWFESYDQPKSSAKVKSSSSSSVKNSSSSKGKSSSSSGKLSLSSSSVVKQSSSSIKSSCSSAKSSSSATSSNSATSSFSGGFDWNLPKETYFNPEIKYDSIIDARDGKVYKTVKIGNQTWMAENLDYADSVATPDLKGRSWCYLNDPKNCGVGGRLYTWAVAKAACPNGWHVPDSTEWTTLFDFVGGQATAGKILKSQEGWNNHGGGLDAYGFTVLPIGHYITDNNFGYQGREAALWSSTEAKSGRGGMYIVYLEHHEDSVFMVGNLTVYGYSVRCIQDTVAPSLSSSSEPKSSSSEQESSSSVTLAVPCKTLTEDNCEYGSFTDERNGKTYKTVKIGDQVWMAENLHYLSPMRYTGPKYTQSCYDNDTLNCIAYGSLHLLNMTMDSVKIAQSLEEPLLCTSKRTMCAYPNQIQGVCTNGWHLPKKAEWETLAAATGGEASAGEGLKSQSGWMNDGNGSDSFGFNALPVGYKDSRNDT